MCERCKHVCVYVCWKYWYLHKTGVRVIWESIDVNAHNNAEVSKEYIFSDFEKTIHIFREKKICCSQRKPSGRLKGKPGLL